ncbi:MAG: acetyl-CoA carboxylase carboxyltransferase subunit beta [Candidatus Aureabacteria bacterium]|nr:acetyl-CoA carboxylase carboxyltransferase subunit beta [Candidatus Auribacterota bacterium]
MSFFGSKFNPFQTSKRKIPDGLFSKCPKCSQTIYNKEIDANLKICPKCEYHFTLGAWERINLMIDKGTFVEMDKSLISADPLNFQGPKTYPQKLSEDQEATGLNEAVICGLGNIMSIPVSFGVTDSRFIMGSMGSVVGEKLTRCIERGIEKKIPVVIVSGSGGGARMYEGCFSLMQMAKTSGALSRLSEAGMPFISILTNPTMGGVLASFASLGDIIIAEPDALIGFAGPRVIAQTVRQELPEGFQKSEYLLKHGNIDRVTNRRNLTQEVFQILQVLYQENRKEVGIEN